MRTESSSSKAGALQSHEAIRARAIAPLGAITEYSNSASNPLSTLLMLSNLQHTAHNSHNSIAPSLAPASQYFNPHPGPTCPPDCRPVLYLQYLYTYSYPYSYPYPYSYLYAYTCPTSSNSEDSARTATALNSPYSPHTYTPHTTYYTVWIKHSPRR